MNVNLGGGQRMVDETTSGSTTNDTAISGSAFTAPGSGFEVGAETLKKPPPIRIGC